MSELRTAATWAARCMHSMLTNGEWYSAEKCLANLYHAIEQHEKQEILLARNTQHAPEHKNGVNQELLSALRRIDEMCAAPPNFSDATIQEIARAALAQPEPPLSTGGWDCSEDGKQIFHDDFEFDAKLKVSGDFATDEQRIEFAQMVTKTLNGVLAQPERKPLSDDQIIAAIKNISYNEMSAFNIARAVEKAHGIGVKE